MKEKEPRFKAEVGRPLSLRWRLIKNTYGRRLNNKHQITSSGVEFIPRRGAGVSISNHRNNKIDAQVLGWVMRKRRIPVIPAKDELIKTKPDASLAKKIGKWVYGKALEGCGAEFFDRDNDKDRIRIAKEMIRKLRSQNWVHLFNEETSHNQGQKLGWISDGPLTMAEAGKLDYLILIGIAGTESPVSERLHVEANIFFLAALHSVIKLRKDTKKHHYNLSAAEVSQLFEEIEGRPALDTNQLTELINPTNLGRRGEKERHVEQRDPVISDVGLADIRAIYNEQVLRPAAQDVIDRAYDEIAV